MYQYVKRIIEKIVKNVTTQNKQRFFNIHNTIHILVSGVNTTQGDGEIDVGTAKTSATLINPRIADCHYRPSSIAPYVNDSKESNETLDQWYGDTSPMSNAVEGADTLLCRTFNTFQQRFGGAQIIARKRLVTNPARTSRSASQILMQKVTQATGIRSCVCVCVCVCVSVVR